MTLNNYGIVFCRMGSTLTKFLHMRGLFLIRDTDKDTGTKLIIRLWKENNISQLNDMYIENAMIIGSGGREHAIGAKLSADNPDLNLYFAPGNGGTSELGQNLDIGPEDIDRLCRFAKEHDTVTIVGPEKPLVAGLVDAFQEDQLTVFGPTSSASRLEGSKAWAVAFMKRHNIPHPRSIIAQSVMQAKQYIEVNDPHSYVIKADGLTNGKGVVLPSSRKEAEQTVDDMMITKTLGEAGKIIVFQERLKGTEVSVLAFSDGQTVVPLLP